MSQNSSHQQVSPSLLTDTTQFFKLCKGLALQGATIDRKNFSNNCQEPLNGPFLNGRFPGHFQEGNGPLRHSGKQPIKVGKRPLKEGKRPIKVNGLFSGTPPRWKTAPLERPITRSMKLNSSPSPGRLQHEISCRKVGHRGGELAENFSAFV